MRTVSAGKSPRHPLWSKDRFLEDLRKYGSIKAVCEIYAPEKGWRAYYADVWRWRKDSDEFDAAVGEVLLSLGTNRPNSGRPRNDEGDKSWQDTYCKALVSNKLALDKSAALTPYSVRQIQDFLDPVCSSYDENFAKMVEAAELVFASRAREMLVDSLSPEAYADFETSKTTQAKVWVATKALTALEPKKFGKRQIEVSGTINHAHQHRLLPPGERMAMLIEDRQKFMLARCEDVKSLSPGENLVLAIDKEEILEAEVVNVDQ